jgi:hypothetical protein
MFVLVVAPEAEVVLRAVRHEHLIARTVVFWDHPDPANAVTFGFSHLWQSAVLPVSFE